MDQHPENNRTEWKTEIRSSIRAAGYEILSEWSENPWQMDLIHPAQIFAVLHISSTEAVIKAAISYFASTPEEWEAVHRVIIGLQDCGLSLEENIPNFTLRPPPHLLCVQASSPLTPDFRSLSTIIRSFTDSILTVLDKIPGSEAL
jgi:hypothetical protein